MDGALDEPEWQSAGVIEDLVQQEPRAGEPTPYRTRVRILSDGRSLYFGFECFDPAPERIAVHTLQRDGDLDGDDTVALALDTFGDRRNGYFFQVNAAGARLDGLISGPEELSFDWDGIWDAKTRRISNGWTAEIAVPAPTLQFRKGLAEWGFNAGRTVARDLMVLFWAGATPDANFEDLSRAGTLTGVEGLEQGWGLSAAPYALGRFSRDREADRSDVTGDVGGEIGYNLTPQLAAVLTVNTDFAETEVDTRQVNLTRFPLFFPEKRPFFLEGSNLFEFGLGLAQRQIFIPFYSRRVGLFEGEVVPIDAGLKVLGRAGRWGITALDVEAGDSAAAPGTNLFAGRLTYDVDPRLRVGAIVTSGDPDGIHDNTLAGLDAVWRTSTFLGDKNLFAGVWGAWSDGDVENGRRTGWGGKLDYPNDLWDVSASFNEFGGALEPALGFLPRPGTRQYRLRGSYQPRPGAAGSFSWARQFFYEMFTGLTERLDGQTESWEIRFVPFNVQTESGERLELAWNPLFERLDAPFEVAEGVVIPPGSYRFTRYRLEAETSPHRPWRVEVEAGFGDFFGGDLTEAQVGVAWTSPGGQLQLEAESVNNFGELPQGGFVQRLWLIKTVFAFHPELVLSSFFQYDSESRTAGMNARVRWTLRPGNDLFVVWNRGWRRGLAERADSYSPLSDQIVVKLRFTFRR